MHVLRVYSSLEEPPRGLEQKHRVPKRLFACCVFAGYYAKQTRGVLADVYLVCMYNAPASLEIQAEKYENEISLYCTWYDCATTVHKRFAKKKRA